MTQAELNKVNAELKSAKFVNDTKVVRVVIGGRVVRKVLRGS